MRLGFIALPLAARPRRWCVCMPVRTMLRSIIPAWRTFSNTYCFLAVTAIPGRSR